MFRVKGALTLITLLLVTLYTTGCGKKDSTPLLEQKSIEVQIDTPVRVEAKEGADEYEWRQIEGVRVEIENSNSRVLSFVAPKVEKEQMLKFEITAKYPFSEKKEILRVVVKPLALEDSDDERDKGGISNGSDDNDISTGGGNDNGTGVSDNNGSTGSGDDNTSTAAIKSLTLKIATATLNKDRNTTITLKALYDDNSTNTPNNIEWLINPKDAVAIKGTTLTALKDTNVTIQAKVGNTLSNQVKLTIYWEVDGHRLPPEPDPKVNNATLLGVDVNHNGVRDDVERWIYDRYKDKHPIHIDIAMQAARGYRLILEKQPKTREEAKGIHYKTTAYLDCQSYYKTYAKYFHDPILIKSDTIGEYFRSKVYFNTPKRKSVYEQYDILLSGDSYSLPDIEELKSLCDFNTSKYEE